MKIIGLTGSTGAGKSAASRILLAMGAKIIDADAVYHGLIENSRDMNSELEEKFPDAYENGKLNRKKLGRIVFNSPDDIKILNSITHRYVMEEIRSLLAEFESDKTDLAVIDAPLLIESGADKLCCETIGIIAPKEVRLKRIAVRDNITEEYARLRIDAQPDDEFYKNSCTYAVINDGTEAELEEKIKNIMINTQKGRTNMKNNELREKLFYSRKNGYDIISSSEKKAVFSYAEGYKKYMTQSKTERKTVNSTIALAESKGFVPYVRGMELNPGDRIYTVNRNKAMILAVIGEKPMDAGVRIVASHIDAPRIDLKPMPLYEDSKELAYFKTHYYGGIKKYQWVTMPLELHGVVALKDGSVVDVEIGTRADDPVFVITDLLPHLGKDQGAKPLSDAITGEGLNILIGSIPSESDTEGSDRVKLAVLEYLYENYGFTETDFLSAELSAVPAYEARDIGFDRSLIGAYGHDDRVCAYPSLTALFELNVPEKTCVSILSDKEEIGSVGSTGMQSAFFDTFMNDLCKKDDVILGECFENSSCLSADVSNAFDPNFAEVSDTKNSAYVNYGVNMMKYTGARGKSGCNDTDAEYIAQLREAFDKYNVIWQTSELGKVDQGGGGTVACYMSNRNIDTVDLGVPVLSMHAPFEVISKLDLYMAHRAMCAFFGMSGEECCDSEEE